MIVIAFPGKELKGFLQLSSGKIAEDTDAAVLGGEQVSRAVKHLKMHGPFRGFSGQSIVCKDAVFVSVQIVGIPQDIDHIDIISGGDEISENIAVAVNL